jgi:hypothetical protein
VDKVPPNDPNEVPPNDPEDPPSDSDDGEDERDGSTYASQRVASSRDEVIITRQKKSPMKQPLMKQPVLLVPI